MKKKKQSKRRNVSKKSPKRGKQVKKPRKAAAKKKKAPKAAAKSKRIPRHRRPVVVRRRQVESPRKQSAEKPEISAKLVKEPVHRAAPKRQLLLCPGPVNLSQHVKAALAGPDMCHREREFSELLQTVRVKLVHALGLGDRYTAVLIGGSGTAALEAAIISSVEPNKKLLVVNNGVYGSRIAQIARLHGLGLTEIRSPIREKPDLNRVAAALKRDAKITTVAMVHHETSTGMINPVEEVGALTKKLHRHFLVDAISSLGAQKLDLHKHHIGFCVGSTGKALHGAAGLSFVLLSQPEAARVLKMRPASMYLNLGQQLRAQEASEPTFTPPVQLVLALNAALDELVKEGLNSRIASYKERAVLLRSGFKKLDLELILGDKELSNSLTALWLPKGIEYEKLHQSLKKSGFVIYSGQSELRNKIFRVAHMGGVTQSDLREFLKSLEFVLE